jgi:hypothetical protein
VLPSKSSLSSPQGWQEEEAGRSQVTILQVCSPPTFWRVH